MAVEPKISPQDHYWCDSSLMCRCSVQEYMLPSDRPCNKDSQLLFWEFHRTLYSARTMWMYIPWQWIFFHCQYYHWLPHNLWTGKRISIVSHRIDTHWNNPKTNSCHCVPVVILNHFQWTPIRRPPNSVRSADNVHSWILSKTIQLLCKLSQTKQPNKLQCSRIFYLSHSDCWHFVESYRWKTFYLPQFNRSDGPMQRLVPSFS